MVLYYTQQNPPHKAARHSKGIMNQKRIWELDAARGFFLIGMIIIHLIYDLVDLYGIWDITLPHWYNLFKNNYGAVFLVLSGISATLGSRPIRRGIQVFLGGMVCTLVTWGMYRFGFADKSIIIYFGVLHSLGVCMVLWAAFRKLPDRLLALLGLAFWGLGMYLRTQYYNFAWLTIFGFAPWWFASSDYFPLFPSFGYFLIGAVLGRRFYARRESLLPNAGWQFPALQWAGRRSLLIYLLHQPILSGLVELIVLFGGSHV